MTGLKLDFGFRGKFRVKLDWMAGVYIVWLYKINVAIVNNFCFNGMPCN